MMLTCIASGHPTPTIIWNKKGEPDYIDGQQPVRYQILPFIIQPCDPTVVICSLIWLCDTAVRITYLISHSSSSSYNTVIKGYFSLGCIINTKLPSCIDIIRRTSLGFPSWCPESIRPMYVLYFTEGFSYLGEP